VKKLFRCCVVGTLLLCLTACGGPREVSDMPYSLDYEGETLEGTYTGTTVEDLPSGEGTFTCTDEDVTFEYTGTWEEGKMVGEGELEYSAYEMTSGEEVEYVGYYVGSVVDGLPSGEGSYESVEEDEYTFVYKGEWKNGRFNGQGKALFDSDEHYDRIGNFENGDFRPTPAEYFVCRGTMDVQDYTVSDNALSFLEAYPDIFKNNTIEGTDVEIDSGFSYTAFAKNPAQYGDKLFAANNLRVVNITEVERYGGEYTHMILVREHSNGADVYYVNMYGFADGIYQGSYVTLTALPLDYFTYPNVENNAVWSIACAGVSVE